MIKLLIFFCCIPGVLFGITLEEKVGQLLLVHFHGEKANDEARKLIQGINVGGIIYYEWANGLTSPEQVNRLSQQLQKLARENPVPLPLLIGVDQEGGVVNRLKHGFTRFPSNRAIAETGDPNYAQSASYLIGRELKSVGVNLNFAPVVDVATQKNHPVIGVRSFGENPQVVVDFAKAALKGYRQAGMLSTLKHFPGHGGVAIDSHHALPLVDRSLEELSKIDLYPFWHLCKEADAVMTAHLLVPALDSKRCATLSETTLSFLRHKIGFKGVIVSDSLVMEGILKQCASVDEAAICALNAGCDLLLLGGRQLQGEEVQVELTADDVERIHHSLVDAVKDGRISESRIESAFERVLELKKRIPPPLSMQLRSPRQALAETIASRALKGPTSIPKLSDKRVLFLAPSLIQDEFLKTSFREMNASTPPFFWKELDPTLEEKEEALREANLADVVVVFSYNAWQHRLQIPLIRELSAQEKPLILAVLGDPLDAQFFPEITSVFKTFDPTLPSLKALSERIVELGTVGTE